MYRRKEGGCGNRVNCSIPISDFASWPRILNSYGSKVPDGSAKRSQGQCPLSTGPRHNPTEKRIIKHRNGNIRIVRSAPTNHNHAATV